MSYLCAIKHNFFSTAKNDTDVLKNSKAFLQEYLVSTCLTAYNRIFTTPRPAPCFLMAPPSYESTVVVWVCVGLLWIPLEF